MTETNSAAGSLQPTMSFKRRASMDGGSLSDLLRNRNNIKNVDDASDTSSQAERKFANLLGGEDDESSIGGDEGYYRNIGHRLYANGTMRDKIREMKLQDERENVLLQEMAELTQRPAITTRARQKPGKGALFAEHAQVWSQQKEDNRRSIARNVRKEREEEVTGTPQINPHSADLVEENGRYVGPVRGWETHFAKFCAKRSVPISPEMFTPNINANAVRGDADKEIGDRLFDDSYSRHQRRRELAKARHEAELIDPATGRPLFTPSSLRSPNDPNHSSSRQRSVKEVSEWLYGSSKDRPKRIKKLEERQKDKELTFSPNLSKKSLAMADKRRQPLYDPSYRRDRSRSADNGRSASAEPESVPRKSIHQADVEEFLRRTERCDQQRQQRLESIKTELEDREGSQCTFQPRISRRSEEIFRSTNLYGEPMDTPGTTLPGGYPSPPRRGSATQQQRQPASRSAVSPRDVSAGASKSSPATSRHAAGARSHVDPTGASPRSPRPGTKSASAAAATSNSSFGGGSNAAAPYGADGTSPAPDVPGADSYISNFEKQMFQVLDEWRKLEEV